MDDELRDLFAEAFQRFLVTEADNIRSGVSERNLCGRLAMILEPLAHSRGLGEYRADIEYNRGGGSQAKVIIDDRYEIVKITCDLILHSRGKLPDDNLIAIEMKRNSHPTLEKHKDRVRLKALTGLPHALHDIRTGQPIEHVTGYRLGYFVELHARRFFSIEEYVGGELARTWRIGLDGREPRLVQQDGPASQAARSATSDLFSH